MYVQSREEECGWEQNLLWSVHYGEENQQMSFCLVIFNRMVYHKVSICPGVSCQATSL